MITILKRFLFTFIASITFVISATNNAQATHAAGADLTYTWLGGNQYRLEVTFYRDCGGVAEPSNVPIKVKSNCGHSFNVTATKISGTGGEITVPCQTSSSTCTGGSSVGIRKFQYQATVTLPTTCALWTFSYSVCCRNCPITTITNPCANSSEIYVESTLNNAVAQNNSSPSFSNIPIAFVCLGQTFNYNHGVLDANGDSLTYEFITPKTGANSTVNFIAPASATNPLSSSTPFTLNSQTGQITFTPNQIQIGIMAIRVKEYRNGVLIGSVIRDMQVYTQVCANQLPTATGINATNNYTATACPGQQICFNVNSNDADAGQSVTMTTNNGITGATYNITGSPYPTLNFCWTPSESQVSPNPYTFTITVKDNACPTNGVQIFSYSIYVTAPAISVSSTNVTCAGLNNGTATVTLQSAGPVSYQWSTLPPSGSASVSNLAPGYYSVTVTDNAGCSAIKNVFIEEPPVLNFSSNATQITCKGSCNGSISIAATGGTPAYSYLWSSGQSTSALTGVCEGSYSVTVTDANSCTATATYTIAPVSDLNLSVNGNSVLCYNGSTGSATLNVSGGAGSYSYLWSNGSTTQNLSNVIAGTYTVTVTDSLNCNKSTSVVISQPPAALNGILTVSQPVSCYGQSDGSINLNVSGGTSPYSYNWSNGAVTQNVSSLAAGTYTVTITDANGCTVIKSAVVTQPAAALSSSVSSNQSVSCFGLLNGSLAVNISGGTAPYSFNWSNGQTTQNISGLAAGTYSVTIADVNGCTTVQTATVTQPSAPLSGTATVTQEVSCFGGSNGSIALTISGGTSPYSYLWSNGSIAQNPGSLPAGSYSVTVSDANGCTFTTSLDISQPSSALSVTSSVQDVDCFGQASGGVNLNVSGGTPSYAFNWSNGSTSEDLSNVAAGNYSVTITDANGCTLSAAVSVSQPAAALSSSSSVVQQVSCYGGTNGSISVTVTGGTTPYSFNWSNGAATQNLSGLSYGTYTVTITDANGCSRQESKTVTQPAIALSATVASVNEVDCYGESSGSVNLSVTGGTAPYSYNWSNGTSSQNLSNVSTGTYSVTVTDANGCTVMTNATVSQPSASLSVSVTSGQQVNCYGGNNGSISSAVSGGTSPYTYNWSNGSSSQNIQNLTAGTYTVTVTDANGCTEIGTATITQPAAALTSSSNVTQQVSCFSGANGSISLTVTGGTSPYAYNWSHGATTQNASGLQAGTYTVTITDANGCTSNQSKTITQPLAALSASTTVTSNISCYSGNNGSISLSVSGGTTPYTYLWNTGATSQNLSSLAAGNYSVVITDANGCTETTTAVISQPAGALSASILVSQAVFCRGGNNGSINLSVTGGTAPYTYLWNNGATSQNLSGLSAGSYTATITDANGCNASVTGTITQPAAVLAINGSVSANVSCYSGSDGSITIIPSGGTTPYTYSWSNGAVTQNLSNLSAGTYTVTVADANGCTQTFSAVVEQPAGALTASLQSSTSVSCYGGADGSIQINVIQGTAPYTYNWSNGATTQNINNLSAGTYSVLITDANGCTNNLSATITQPSGALTASLQSSTNVNCYGGGNGSIQINVIQGTAPYTYNWSNGATTQNLTNLSSGTYIVTVTDANGCTKNLSAIITQPSGALTATLQSSTNVSCYAGSNGEIQVNVIQGTSPYSYSWSNGSTSQNIINLPAGTYTVTVTDANGCTETLSTSITQPSGVLTATLQSLTNVSCYAGNNGEIQVNVVQGTSPYSYSWSNGSTSQNIANLPAGNYTVTVTDANGCTETLSAAITQPSGALTATLQSSANVSCYAGANGEIQVNVTQGTAPYFFNWSNGATTQNISNLSSGTYSVTITDANGCTSNLSVSISQPSAPLSGSATVTSNISCYSGNNGTVDLTVTGGTSPYTYLWSNGSTTQDLTGVGAGTYSVTVTDANGCIFTASSTITQPVGALSVSASISQNVNCYGGNDGSVALNVGGGTQPYSYSWSNGSTSQNINNLVAGVYTVTVTDINGCFVTATATVAEPQGELDVTLQSSQNVNCYGGSNGNIQINVTMGTAPYSYLWNTGATTQNLNGVPTGVYTVTVTDANGCTQNESVYIGQPQAALSLSLTATQNASCFGFSDGEIVSVASDGTAPYTYLWNTGDTTSGLSNLPAGIYTVTVTDANGCTEVQSQAITQPAGALNIALQSYQNISCYRGSDGEINLTVTQGTAPYTFNWSNGAVTQNLTNITVGAYTVTVTDANGCSDTLSYTLTEPAGALSPYLAAQQNVNCFGGSDASIDLEVLAGTAPYTYLWNTGAVTQDLNNVSAGTYTVTVTDANGCVETLTTTVIEPAGALDVNVSSIQSVDCYGGSTGSISVNVNMGTIPYAFNWSNGAVTQNISNVPAGTYTLTVTDAQGCVETETVIVTQPQAALSAVIQTIQDADCFGSSTGSVSINVNQGTAPYSYNWSTGDTTQNLSNIASGTYTVTVTDANGCTQTLAAVIGQPLGALTASLNAMQSVACYGGSNGSISVNVTQGTPPYAYLWNTGATTQNIYGLSAGNYVVTITDSNGCIDTLSVLVTEPAGALTVNLQTAQNVSCYGGNDGSVQLTVTQGTAPYTYNWSNGVTTQNQTGLAAGIYSVTVTDANGCTEVASATISQPQGALQVSVSSSQNVNCFNGTDGQLTIAVTQGTSPYTYLWNNGSTTPSLTNITAGTYSVTVTDANGCTEILSATIGQPLQPLMMTGSTSSSNCLAGLGGSVNINPDGGTAPYSFNWSNGATSQNLTNVPDGSYFITITDANNCSATSQFVITDISEFNAHADGPSTICVGNVAFLIADSIPGATYQWYLNQQTLGGAVHPHFVTPVAGSYTVTIQHTCGSFTSQPIEITVNSVANISVSPNVIICPGESTQLLASGGINYSWTPVSGLDFPNVPNPVAAPAATTIYTVEVENDLGCRASAQVTVTVFCDTLIIPSGYSPNNDGVNDGFEIVGIDKYPNNKIWIYNRWGNLVYKASGYNNEWNGYSNVSGVYIGKKVPAGTYFYVLDLGDNQKPKQGYIVLRY